ncbi:MAG: HD-GYP domain-containing protein [Planctomycetaceae bacterium]
MLIDQAGTLAGAVNGEGARSPGAVDEPVGAALARVSRILRLPLVCCDARSGAVAESPEGTLAPVFPPNLAQRALESRSGCVLPGSRGLHYFAIPLVGEASEGLVACGYALEHAGARPAELVLAAAAAGWSAQQLDTWLRKLPYCDALLLERLVALAASDLANAQEHESIRADYERIAEQLDYTFEELSLLHRLTQNMQLSRSPREIADLSLERIATMIPAEGHAIWLDDKREGRLFLIDGQLPFDEMGMGRLIARFDGHEWPRPLVRNHVEGTLLGADFPGLRNLALVAIADDNLRFGWICSCNFSGGQCFGSIQTGLLSSVASILGTHQHNLELYRQHEDLLLGFVRSLVSTLDAKDTYTRGHSERVALIARRLGAQLGLPDDDLRDIYLSGLLHDIGKVGVDDQVLRKTGQLTREEFEHVKRHPVIGYNILAGLKNLRAVLPGVRHHHEAYKGTGYPDGLQGEEIPLMARIIAVADSYDAMSSDRPYRPGLQLAELERILREGAGVQWDPRVVCAYFELRDEILDICTTYSPTQSSLLAAAAGGADAPVDPLRAIDDIRTSLRAAAGL